MTRLVVRPLVPVCLAGLAALGVVAVLTLSASGPSPSFVVQVAVVVLACGPAFLLDEPSAEASDVTPRTRGVRHIGVVVAGLVVLVLGWVAMAVLLQNTVPKLPLRELTFEVVALGLTAVASAALLRRRRDPTPGTTVASVLALVALAEVIGGPLRAVLDAMVAPLSPTVLWSALAGAASAVLVLGSRDVAAPRLSHLRRARPARRARGSTSRG